MHSIQEAPKARHLSDYTSGHDNNFTLLRFSAALLVLITHSFALSTGNYEPLRDTLGITLGSLAVDIFFVASGFLVTGSLLYRKHLRGFLLARGLRIFPGLWVSLWVTVIVLGLLFTTLPAAAFFSSRDTWSFLLHNASLLRGIIWTLPETFLNNPGKNAVNGSLWSLPSEVKMYLVLAALWIAASVLRLDKARWLARGTIAIAVVCTAGSLLFYRDGAQSNLTYLGAMFFTGAAFHVLQARIPASRNLAIAMLLSLLGAAFLSRPLFGILYRLSLPYLVLYLALVPSGKIRLFNRFGDYSYGLYIYAFPVQQCLAQLFPGIQPVPMMAASFTVTLLLAVASWHWIENRALALKDRFSFR